VHSAIKLSLFVYFFLARRYPHATMQMDNIEPMSSAVPDVCMHGGSRVVLVRERMLMVLLFGLYMGF